MRRPLLTSETAVSFRNERVVNSSADSAFPVRKVGSQRIEEKIPWRRRACLWPKSKRPAELFAALKRMKTMGRGISADGGVSRSSEEEGSRGRGLGMTVSHWAPRASMAETEQGELRGLEWEAL